MLSHCIMALKQVYSSRDAMEAHLLRDLLQDQGISAVVEGELLASAAGVAAIGITANPRVCVNEGDVARAEPLVKEFEQRAAREFPRESGPPWICPRCRETVEAQFTDCWNCQTPRPRDGQPPEPADVGPADPTLDVDVACRRCEYDLRGLTPMHRCPECGLPVLYSLLDLLRDGSPPEADKLHSLLYRPFESAVAPLGHPASALILVCHAWLHATEPVDAEAQSRDEQTSASDRFRTALRTHAVAYFGDPEAAKAGMEAWGIRNIEEAGHIVCGLMDLHLLDPANRSLARSLGSVFG
jgi:hypothetical protein